MEKNQAQVIRRGFRRENMPIIKQIYAKINEESEESVEEMSIELSEHHDEGQEVNSNDKASMNPKSN